MVSRSWTCSNFNHLIWIRRIFLNVFVCLFVLFYWFGSTALNKNGISIAPDLILLFFFPLFFSETVWKKVWGIYNGDSDNLAKQTNIRVLN